MKSGPKFLLVFVIFSFLTGCSMHIRPQKFDLDHQQLRSFKSDEPIQIVVPSNAETEHLVESLSWWASPPKVYVDLNDLYRNAGELIAEVLDKNKVPFSPNAKKYLKFTITKAQWEKWASGPMVEAYLEFDVETGDGYKKHYRVQDRSFSNVERAVGGTTSRAVEKVFQDEKILHYIQSPFVDRRTAG